MLNEMIRLGCDVMSVECVSREKEFYSSIRCIE